MPNDFEPRMLADGRVCCSHEYALCKTCEAHHAREAAKLSATTPDTYGINAQPNVRRLALRAAAEAGSVPRSYDMYIALRSK